MACGLHSPSRYFGIWAGEAVTRRFEKMSWLAAAIVVAVFAALLTPLCTMPSCDDTGAGGCSDFKPACDECPDTLVMKHSYDDALASVSAPVAELVALAYTPHTVEAVVVVRALDAPDATASPPPLDPLGVRLSV